MYYIIEPYFIIRGKKVILAEMEFQNKEQANDYKQALESKGTGYTAFTFDSNDSMVERIEK